jgi:hypothetical protein
VTKNARNKTKNARRKTKDAGTTAQAPRSPNAVIARLARGGVVEKVFVTKNVGNKTKSAGKWAKNAACLAASGL